MNKFYLKCKNPTCSSEIFYNHYYVSIDPGYCRVYRIMCSLCNTHTNYEAFLQRGYHARQWMATYNNIYFSFDVLGNYFSLPGNIGNYHKTLIKNTKENFLKCQKICKMSNYV